MCSESNPAYHVVLPQHYLARNPYLAVPTALNDLSPGVTPIFRISPIEKLARRSVPAGGWRPASGPPTSAGLSHNVIDAAAGLTIYRGHAYPTEYRGNLFVGCSQNNLVHRRKLIPDGATFRSPSGPTQNTEFVRSTDTWFRPVNCINAPDGTLYVLDMSREVIESIHIASDVVAHLDLTNGRDKGRIYRLAPPGFKAPPQPRLGQATTAELVAYLEHPGRLVARHGLAIDLRAAGSLDRRALLAGAWPSRRRTSAACTSCGRSTDWVRSKSAISCAAWPMRRRACASMPCDWPSRFWLALRRSFTKSSRWPPTPTRASAFRSRLLWAT